MQLGLQNVWHPKIRKEDTMDIQNTVMNLVQSKPDGNKVMPKKQNSNKKQDFSTQLYQMQKQDHSSRKNEIRQKSTKSAALQNHTRIKNEDTIEKTWKKIMTKEEPICSKKQLNEKVIEKIAEKLSVTTEKVQEILDEVGIEAIDLFDPTQMQLFVQVFMNVEQPSDLLLISHALEVYKEIQGVVQELTPDYEMVQYHEINEQVILHVNQETHNKPEHTVDHEKRRFIVEEDTEEHQEVFTQPKNSIKQALQLTQEIAKEKASIIEISKEVVEEQSSEDAVKELSTQGMMQDVPSEDVDIDEANSTMHKQPMITPIQIDKNLSEISTVQDIQPKNATADVQQVINQIVDHMKITIKQDAAEINLKLKPEHLGDLSLKIITERGIVTAQFVAESQQVKEIIEANFNHLKNVLQEQGLKVDQLSVSVGQQHQNDTDHEFKKQGKSKKRVQQIIDTVNGGEVDLYEDSPTNPYELSDNQVDYSA